MSAEQHQASTQTNTFTRATWRWRSSPGHLLHLYLLPTSSLLTQGQEEDLDVAAVVGRVHRNVGVAVVSKDQWAGVPERPDRLLHLWALFNPPQDISGQSRAVGDTLNTNRLA